MGRNPIGDCKLCGNHGELCRSHVIPDAFYRDIKGLDPNFMRMSQKEGIKNKPINTGIWEHLLCSSCEQRLGVYDKYAYEFTKGLRSASLVLKPKMFVVSHNINFEVMRLFQISLLWRAIISTREDFKEASFHSKHELRLRKMILNKDIDNPTEYGCFMILVLSDENTIIDSQMETSGKTYFHGFTYLRFIFGGIIWKFVVGSHMEASPFKNFYLTRGKGLAIRTLHYQKVGMALEMMDTEKLQQVIDYYAKRK